ncbi:hypothetical protein OK074_5772 [Actinobacteria bacterium OK074]|nr:hypothetical protein OK074_5772 [Actinobacteria bacterium OK074]
MFRRREPVPFAFIAEADKFRSNVAPPPRERASAGQTAMRWLTGLTIVAALVGAVIIATPSLSLNLSSTSAQHSEASNGR